MGDIAYETMEDYRARIRELEEENKNLKEDNELLNNELAWMKAHTRYNGITKEEYIDGTMTATEAKLRLQQAEDNQKTNIMLVQYMADYKNKITDLEEENRKLKLHIEAKDKAYTALLKDYEELKEDRKKILKEIDSEIERFKDFKKTLEK